MSEINQLSQQIQQLFQKYDINKDNNIDDNEASKMSDADRSIWDSAKAEDRGQLLGAKGMSQTASTDAKQLFSDANVAPEVADLFVKAGFKSAEDVKLAQKFIDAGYTSAEDVNYIKSITLSCEQYRVLSPEQQEAAIEEITSSTSQLIGKGIDAETAKIMVKAGVKGTENLEAVQNLLTDPKFSALESGQKNLLLKHIKFPGAIDSLVNHAEFNNFSFNDKDKTLHMESSGHQYAMNLKVDDNDMLRNMTISYSTSPGKETFSVANAKGELLLNEYPEGVDVPKPAPVRDVRLYNVGDTGPGNSLKIINKTNNSYIYHLQPEINKPKSACSSYVTIETANPKDKVYSFTEFPTRKDKNEVGTIAVHRNTWYLKPGAYNISLRASFEKIDPDKIGGNYTSTFLTGLGSPDVVKDKNGADITNCA